MVPRQRPGAVEQLCSATCSNGAPSARNLLVTVFGDALLPHGADTTISVRSLTELVASFGVSERLVRTSLTRLVNEGLLAAGDGRRGFYGVAFGARDLFRRADDRIYGADGEAGDGWDGSWTIVVIDGSESTAHRRSQLRQELAWAGLGSVAPNVMASPVVSADVAAQVVARVGGFRNVLVSRSNVVESAGTLGADELAHRVAALGEIGEGYADFVASFERFDEPTVDGLDPEQSFKLRTLLIARFRRIVLTDPQLPAVLLPTDWIGTRARRLAGEVYSRAAPKSERFLCAVADPHLAPLPGIATRFAPDR